MELIKKHTVSKLLTSRKELLQIPITDLTFSKILEWHPRWLSTFRKAEALGSQLIEANLRLYCQGFDNTESPEEVDELRVRLADLISRAANGIENSVNVRPVLDELIAKVSDIKLAKMLQEFNAIRNSQPNHAAIGFRTILSLLIKEKAKRSDPDSTLAKDPDLNFDDDISNAVRLNIWPEQSTERRMLSRYFASSWKTINHVVAHKVGEVALVDKEDLNESVKLLNTLLPSIVS